MAKIWNCHPQAVLDTPTDLVITALQYEVFMKEFEETFLEINKE